MIRCLTLAAAGSISAALPVQAVDCRLDLAPAVDVSSSVNARKDTLQRGGIVAALTVIGQVANAADFEGEVHLIAFYKRQVLHNPGVFVIIADGFVHYERSMRRKFKRELSPPSICAPASLRDAG